jgi:arginine decarboxylase
VTDHSQAVLVDELSERIKHDRKNDQDKVPVSRYWLNIDDIRVQTGEAMAADIYGAQQTRFLTNGSTQGIHALIMTACKPGDKILLPRNVHRSVLGGLVLSGAEPVFVMPQYDEERGLLRQIHADDVAMALAENPDCQAVLVVSPNYQGVAAELSRLADLCHQRKIPLLVDEAHGPHAGFHPDLPASALSCGADGTVQSTHKLMGALTQSSMVHIQGELLDTQRFQDVIDLLRPRAASLMLLASLDGARRQLALYGNELLDCAVKLAAFARMQINDMPHLKCYTAAEMSGAAFDGTKLTVRVSDLGMSGPEAEDILRRHHRIQAEYADLHNLLFLITIGDSEETVAALLAALDALSRTPGKSGQEGPYFPLPSQGWERAISLQEAYFAEFISLPLAESVDRISHGVICPYPPGIPVVYPGERLTADSVNYLMRVWHAGIPVLGLKENEGEPFVPVVRLEENAWKITI